MASANKRVILVGEDDDVKASVTERGSKGVLGVEILDASGNQVTDFSGSGGATTPAIYNVSLPAPNDERSQVLPASTKRFRIFAVNSAKTRPHTAVLTFAYSATATNVIPIPAGSYYEVTGLSLTSTTLYFQSPIGGAIVVIEAWV